MKKITGITRRDIIELFQEGYTETSLFGDTSDKYFYQYYGRLTELDFLEKLYPLEDMPSDDLRFKNAKEDIWQHTINNDDYELGWVFNDARFGLLKGDDTVLLDFLCAVFHPENRNDQGFWKEYFNKINTLIKVDGYEFYVSDKISGREIYSWRPLSREEVLSGKFKPFSIRHKADIKVGVIKTTISKKIRREVMNIFTRYDGIEYKTTETNWNYSISTKEAVLEDIREHYTPKYFNAKSKYTETESLEDFILHNYPYQVFDAIEFFADYNQDNDYSRNINDLFQSNAISYKLLDGKIDLVHKQEQVVNQTVSLNRSSSEFKDVSVEDDKAPVVFISYSWDGEEHEEWVLDLATKLRNKGVDVILDKWDLGPYGSLLPSFMEQSITKSNRVICILTPNYKKKTDNLSGGVGYEYSIISSNIFKDSKNRTKFIPLLKSGSIENSVPGALDGGYHIDMRDNSFFDENFKRLLRDVFCEPEFKKPPLGKRPKFE